MAPVGLETKAISGLVPLQVLNNLEIFMAGGVRTVIEAVDETCAQFPAAITVFVMTYVPAGVNTASIVPGVTPTPLANTTARSLAVNTPASVGAVGTALVVTDGQ